MKWDELDTVWKKCFELGWMSYLEGSLPISALVVDRDGNILSTGRNMIHSKSNDDSVLANSTIAHAEMNAIASHAALNTKDKDVTLYCTTEPCPMCFGTFIMSNIRNMVYASSENYAGSVDLIDGNEYMMSKKSSRSIKGPVEAIEDYQMVLDTLFFYNENGFRHGFVVIKHEKQYPKAVALAKKIYTEKLLDKFVENKEDVSIVFDYINELLDTTPFS